MAHKKAGGSTALGRDSQPQYLGVKLYAGQKAKPGSIIIRQRGTHFRPGKNVEIGKDDTIYAIKEGVVQFSQKKAGKFNGRTEKVKVVNVVEDVKKV